MADGGRSGPSTGGEGGDDGDTVWFREAGEGVLVVVMEVAAAGEREVEDRYLVSAAREALALEGVANGN